MVVLSADKATISPASHAGDLPLSLTGQLRLNLSALGVDDSASDFVERLYQLGNDNEPYRFEYSAQGELVIMAPPGPEGNLDEREINDSLSAWRRANGGENYTQTALFRLPGGGRRMPDAAWINQERYDNLTAEERRVAINGAPDFVVEVRSRTDHLMPIQAKMQEWLNGGCRLGWLIDPYERCVHIYRAGQAVAVVEDPRTLSGEDVLPGFVFEVGRLIFARHDALPC